MPQLSQLISRLEQLEAQKFVSTDVAGRQVNADACRQLLTDLTSLRDRFSMRAYFELYDRTIAVERSFE